MLPADQLFKDNVTFPMVDPTGLESKPNWTLDNMLELADLLQTIPRHIDSNGRWAGLYFEMEKRTPTKQSLCGQSAITAKVVFHHPGEIPLPDTHKFYDLPVLKDYFIHLTPRLITSSEELKDYTPGDRRCHFSHERTLSLFRSYSQRNCQLECRVNCSLSLCDCVPYYFPRHNDSVKICGRQHTEYCVELYLTAILGGRYTWREIVLDYREWVGDRIQRLFKDYQYNRRGTGKWNVTDQLLEDTYPDCRCECPVACSSLTYDVEVNQQPLPDLGRVDRRLAISFKELEFTTVLRKELIGLTDFIADSGGVLGVFTGFTFLAVVELLYYLTLRLWKNIKYSWEEVENSVEDMEATDFH
ncbi:pickpocket protein 28-like [Macrosteles quadrilineatus]|uniref:pickpocket protein 28-like n=1 Tax=Macrosteles quadrilineatus TaxID=74068 RepID=UPI0023E1AF49|nr:pickpocket protein 28-like [Macrosteles quadrilineatus]